MMSFGDEKQRGQESQALVYDGIIYVTASYSRIFAMDARTGEKLWTYSHRLPEGIRPCCDVVNRGAAIFGCALADIIERHASTFFMMESSTFFHLRATIHRYARATKMTHS